MEPVTNSFQKLKKINVRKVKDFLVDKFILQNPKMR
jgi:hypothetical protein